MPDFDAWIGDAVPLTAWSDLDRAHDTARTIADKSSSIVIIRDSVAQPAQTVRLEVVSSPSVRPGDNVVAMKQSILILGYKDHPTISDTDIQRGDRFYVVGGDGVRYMVMDVMTNIPARLLATAEATR